MKRRRTLRRMHRQRKTPRTNPRRTRPTRNLNHHSRPIPITILGNPMVALPANNKPQIPDRRRKNQTHSRRTPRIQHNNPRILRHPRRLDQPRLPIRLPSLTHRRRSQRRPKIPVSTRLRTQMANPTNGKHHPTHHTPQQIRRKTRHRSTTPTPLQVRCSTSPIHARKLENISPCRRTNQMDPRQKKRHRPSDGKLVRRTTLPYSQRSKTSAKTMASIMDANIVL